jgi:hypothetical protein
MYTVEKITRKYIWQKRKVKHHVEMDKSNPLEPLGYFITVFCAKTKHKNQ